MGSLFSIGNVFLALFLAPLLPGITNRTKAFFAGRRGQPLLQLYFDLYKLLHKVPVYSRTTTAIFRLSPMAGLAALAVAAAIMPYAGMNGLLAFPGDLVLFLYLLGMARFLTVLAALDTGSSFEGMGASREAEFSALAEPVVFLSLAALALKTQAISLSGIYSNLNLSVWSQIGPVVALVGFAILVVFLVENSRMPFDDPNTHLELTMVHEAMTLDHSGIDLAYILYGAALKFWLLGTMFVGLVFPFHSASAALNLLVFLAGMAGLAVVVGIIESTMTRLRLLKVPHLLLAALSVAILALIIQIRA